MFFFTKGRSRIKEGAWEDIHLVGQCRGVMTYLDYKEVNGVLVPIDTKIIVPGSDTGWNKNTIQTQLKCHLIHRAVTNTNDYAMNNLFATNGTVASVGAANDAKDGITFGNPSPCTVTHILTTTLNDGGTGAEAYFEFYGYIDGAQTLAGAYGYFMMGYAYDNDSSPKAYLPAGFYASYYVGAITIPAARRYAWYHKISIT